MHAPIMDEDPQYGVDDTSFILNDTVLTSFVDTIHCLSGKVARLCITVKYAESLEFFRLFFYFHWMISNKPVFRPAWWYTGACGFRLYNFNRICPCCTKNYYRSTSALSSTLNWGQPSLNRPEVGEQGARKHPRQTQGKYDKHVEIRGQWWPAFVL